MPRIKGIAVEFALRNIRVVVAGQKWTVRTRGLSLHMKVGRLESWELLKPY